VLKGVMHRAPWLQVGCLGTCKFARHFCLLLIAVCTSTSTSHSPSTSSRPTIPITPHNSSQELITSLKMGKDSFAPGTLPSQNLARWRHEDDVETQRALAGDGLEMLRGRLASKASRNRPAVSPRSHIATSCFTGASIAKHD
jgi:hypothetical protein